MIGLPIVLGGLMVGSITMGASAFRHGYRLGEVQGQLRALQGLKDNRSPNLAGSLFFTAPTDASPDEEAAWNADFLKRGGEYADGQIAFKRAQARSNAGHNTVEHLREPG